MDKTAKPAPRTNEGPRNPNATSQTQTTTHEEDAMHLDATRGKPRLNRSCDEFQPRMPEHLCLQCGKMDDQIADCNKNNQQRKFNLPATIWQPGKKPPTWQVRQGIRDREMETVSEKSENEESAQEEMV